MELLPLPPALPHVTDAAVYTALFTLTVPPLNLKDSFFTQNNHLYRQFHLKFILIFRLFIFVIPGDL